MLRPHRGADILRIGETDVPRCRGVCHRLLHRPQRGNLPPVPYSRRALDLAAGLPRDRPRPRDLGRSMHLDAAAAGAGAGRAGRMGRVRHLGARYHRGRRRVPYVLHRQRCAEQPGDRHGQFVRPAPLGQASRQSAGHAGRVVRSRGRPRCRRPRRHGVCRPGARALPDVLHRNAGRWAGLHRAGAIGGQPTTHCWNAGLAPASTQPSTA